MTKLTLKNNYEAMQQALDKLTKGGDPFVPEVRLAIFQNKFQISSYEHEILDMLDDAVKNGIIYQDDIDLYEGKLENLYLLNHILCNPKYEVDFSTYLSKPLEEDEDPFF